jgi:maltose alpha-D-glucosyltransferase/alpha-amylase
LALRPADSAAEIIHDNSESPILKVESPYGIFLVYEALGDKEFLRTQLQQIETSSMLEGGRGRFRFSSTGALSDITKGQSPYQIKSLRRLKAEQSNTSVIFNDSLIMKNFRRLRNGANPDLEMSLFLTTQTRFKNIPPVAGYVEYSGEDDFHATIASFQGFVPNQGDGWIYTLDHLHTLYQFVLQNEQESSAVRPPGPVQREEAIRQFSHSYLQDIRHLGRITGALHDALTSEPTSPDFVPEHITGADVRQWVSSIQAYTSEVMRALNNRSTTYPAPVGEQIRQVVSNSSFYLRKAEELVVLAEGSIWKMRFHNDYHLGQVLKADDDFVIIDFEGEPARPLEERRAKQSPLKDVAGMLRSFNYAAYAALFELAPTRSDKQETLEVWGKTWETLACNTFLDGYLEVTGGTTAGFLPNSLEATRKVLSVFLLDKAIYELNYELNNRPTWLEIPLKYLLSLL